MTPSASSAPSAPSAPTTTSPEAADIPLPEPVPAGRWSPDVLGAGFEAQTLPLLADDEGPVDATVVRHRPADDPQAFRDTPSSPGSFAVLYLHGWNDYFYQADIARRFSQLGGAFYALDLRKYGRSLRAHQTRGYMESLRTYDEDLHAALRLIRSEHGRNIPLVLGGHSTGGLTAALWAHRHPGALAGLVLNSPWLELQGSAIMRGLAQPVTSGLAKAQPKTALPVGGGSHYQRTLTGWDEEQGPRPEGPDDDPFIVGWNPDPAWRLERAIVRAGWLRAVLDGHAQVADGLEITCPVLVMTSGRTVLTPKWSPEMRESDVVLDVEQMRRRALQLGPHLTLLRLDGAVHDVMLSAKPVRDRAHAELARWARTYVR